MVGLAFYIIRCSNDRTDAAIEKILKPENGSKFRLPVIKIFETQVQLQVIIRSKEIMRPKVRLTFEFTSLAYSELSLGIYSENLNNEQLFSLILV